jgi:hypothetical protein
MAEENCENVEAKKEFSTQFLKTDFEPHTAQPETETKSSGLKTIKCLKSIHGVNTAVKNVTNYYSRIKQKNDFFRTYFQFIAFTLQIFIFVVSPFVRLFKQPINVIDTYLNEKLKNWTQSYSKLSKPSVQLSECIRLLTKELYDIGCQLWNKVNLILDNKYTKSFVYPALDMVEKLLDYLCPPDYIELEKNQIPTINDYQTTLGRFWYINNKFCRVLFKQVYKQAVSQWKVLYENSKLSLDLQLSSNINLSKNSKPDRSLSSLNNYIDSSSDLDSSDGYSESQSELTQSESNSESNYCLETNRTNKRPSELCNLNGNRLPKALATRSGESSNSNFNINVKNNFNISLILN